MKFILLIVILAFCDVAMANSAEQNQNLRGKHHHAEQRNVRERSLQHEESPRDSGDEERPTWTLEVVTKSSPTTFQYKYHELRLTSSNGDLYDVAQDDVMSMLRSFDNVDEWWNARPVYEPVKDDEGAWQLSFREWIIWNTGTGEFMTWDYDYYNIADLTDRLNNCAIQFQNHNKPSQYVSCEGIGASMDHAEARAIYESSLEPAPGQAPPAFDP